MNKLIITADIEELTSDDYDNLIDFLMQLGLENIRVEEDK